MYGEHSLTVDGGRDGDQDITADATDATGGGINKMDYAGTGL